MHARAELKQSGRVPPPMAWVARRSAASTDIPRASRGGCACGGACPRCRGKAAYHVSQPGDAGERAADAMAHAALAREDAPGRDAAGTLAVRAADAPAELVPGAGEPLAPAVRGEFEGRFGADFSAVRIHHDARAAETADALAAHAYAVGPHIAFAGGRYAPQTPAGRRLLAHELAHVVQHARDPSPVVSRQGDEPLIPIPIFDELDICAEVEGRRLCGSDLKKACEIIPGLPHCGLFKKKEKKPKPKPTLCPPGFRAGTASGFEGTCCRGEIHSEQNCCPPERITTGAVFPVCCPPGTRPDADKKACERPLECPPEQQAFGGRCCEPPLVPQGFACVEPKPQPKPKPKPVPPAVTTILTTAIAFERDRPQSWYHPAAAFGVSVTGSGKKAFDSLAKLLAAEPDLKVQLAGNASIEKPADDPGYNQRLTERRVQLIAAELAKRGIDPARIADPSDAPSLPGCDELADGVHACGDTGAQQTTAATDRNVTARVYRTGAGARRFSAASPGSARPIVQAACRPPWQGHRAAFARSAHPPRRVNRDPAQACSARDSPCDSVAARARAAGTAVATLKRGSSTDEAGHRLARRCSICGSTAATRGIAASASSSRSVSATSPLAAVTHAASGA